VHDYSSIRVISELFLVIFDGICANRVLADSDRNLVSLDRIIIKFGR
jgi:hypothetical protein